MEPSGLRAIGIEMPRQSQASTTRSADVDHDPLSHQPGPCREPPNERFVAKMLLAFGQESPGGGVVLLCLKGVAVLVQLTENPRPRRLLHGVHDAREGPGLLDLDPTQRLGHKTVESLLVPVGQLETHHQGKHRSSFANQGFQVRPVLSGSAITETPSSRHKSRRCGSAEASEEPSGRAVSAAKQSARLTARFFR